MVLLPLIFYECLKFVDCIELAGQSVKTPLPAICPLKS